MMQLIVLGKIPGTNIQLTFELLANVFAGFVLLVLAKMYVTSHRSQSKGAKAHTIRSLSSKLHKLVPHSY